MLMAELGEDNHGGPLAEVSRGLVQLHRRYYGKGPTTARTYMLDDSVISLLHGGFTTVERTLIEDGNVDAVHNVRHAFQTSMETLFRRVVEDALDRKVIAYMSQVHHDPDLAAELFMLEPLSEPVTAEDEEG
jgi:uncharacterized protein YbcI